MPNADRLTTTSYAVLAQVAVRPWSAYELAEQRVRYFRYVWPRAESAIYREVKRLSKLGLLDDTREYNGRRPRTVYALTDAGRRALEEWLGTPVTPFSMEFEALLRLIIAPLGTKGDLVDTLAQVQADAQEMLGFAGAVKQEFLDGINVAQHDVHLRALLVDFFVSLLHTVDDWTQRTAAEIESWNDLELSDEKRDRAIELIRRLPTLPPVDSDTGVAKPPERQMRTRS
ncbi:MAG: PadR family transcriptional regulator [Ilumatobacteraceae bacterium]|nr:PadR family transcriptional regulator [Ilumatobacteraceae bacterium]